MHGVSLDKQGSVAINHRRYLHCSDAAISVVGEPEVLTLAKPIGTTKFESTSATPIAARFQALAKNWYRLVTGRLICLYMTMMITLR
jgi:hypothetical protein